MNPSSFSLQVKAGEKWHLLNLSLKKKNANSTLCFVTPEKNLQNLLGGIVKGKE